MSFFKQEPLQPNQINHTSSDPSSGAANYYDSAEQLFLQALNSSVTDGFEAAAPNVESRKDSTLNAATTSHGGAGGGFHDAPTAFEVEPSR